MIFDWLEVHTKLTLVNLILTKTNFPQNFVVGERLKMLVNNEFLTRVTCHTQLQYVSGLWPSKQNHTHLRSCSRI